MTEIVKKDRIQRDDSNPLHYHSNFRDNGYKLAGTYRYGEYAPTMVLDCICDDKHRIKTSHKVKSYTMKQPLFQDINLHDDTFFVPDSAILPLNCDKLATIPNIGDDVDAKEVGTSVVGFSKIIYDFFTAWISFISHIDDNSINARLQFSLQFLSMYDTILSTGSLLSSMGAPLIADAVAVDRLIDTSLKQLEGLEFNVHFGDKVYNVGASAPNGPGEYVISLREFWQKIHDDYDFTVFPIDADSSLAGAVAIIFSTVTSIPTVPSALPVQDEEAPLDLRYFWAYQITCAHFYSNDKVDYVYSAELYRQLIGGYLSTYFSGIGSPEIFNSQFVVNGLSYRYDYLSAFYFKKLFEALLIDSDFSQPYVFAYLRALFGYNRSLRYVDYFTGSRTLPLAPGDTSVEVKDNGINVVENIQKRWYIRLWSQISRVGRKRSEQMKGLFPGVENTVDWHDPIWIKASQGNVFAEEVDNTGSNQFSEDTPIAVTSSLHGGGSISLEMSVADREGILITITYFDIRRYYSHGIDRHFFYVDRFDRFQPFLQFNGDQKVYQKELNSDSLFVNVFGYQGRYEEYKTRMDRAFGGFSENSVLPGMIFLADEGRDRFSIDNIGPNYIRSYPAELDKFFISLSGWSLGTYFHFMMLTDNEIDSDRPMSYNPQIQ